MAGNLQWGLRWGVTFGAGYAILGALLLAVRGSRFLEPLGLDVGEFILAYPLAGAVVGAVAGLCRPMLRSRVGTAIAGMAAAVPGACIVLFLMADPEHPIRPWRFVLTVVIFAAVAGPLAALRVRDVFGASDVDG